MKLQKAQKAQNEWGIGVLRRAGYGLISLLMLLPVWLWIDEYTAQPPLQRYWLLGLVPLLLAAAWLQPLVRPLWTRLTVSLLAGILFLLPGILDLSHSIFVAAAGFAAALFLLSVSDYHSRIRLYGIGMASYFVGGIYFSRTPALTPWVPLLVGCGAVCLAFTLLYMNEGRLRKASFSGSGPSKAAPELIRRNRVYVAVLFLAALLLAAGLGSLLGRTVLGAIRWLLAKIFTGSSSEPVPQPPAEPVPPQGMPEVAEHGPDRITEILNTLFYIFGYTALAIVAGGLLYAAYRYGGENFRRGWASLLSGLRRRSAESEKAGYTDEESRVSRKEEPGPAPLRGWRRFFTRGGTAVRWEELAPRERVRYLYRRWLDRQRQEGYQPSPASTPLEIVQDEQREAGKAAAAADPQAERKLVDAYYRARYGAEQPAAEEVESLRNRLKRK
ncbi:hypothetical protein DCC85_01900 [Paenibacillus sp. CAA11]|uniref:DUF4129 domain-containing protein n=1 Tax=Paenibacillus sp. CAA11 TaxID=1532905 RepID=UPI000D346166|nr:DUF4129 domain-containing protein [Paenibacillus sp. CAA11]AWB43108.1 hypothetical protein DCC85_01900 [Paenibacillus sp. CAA11]